MSRGKMVAGNWKMNGSRKTVKSLLHELKLGLPNKSHEVEVALFPPYIFLPELQQQLKASSIVWGGQNLSDKEQGAFTGEISASMLLDYECKYVIVGHSERRILYQETNAVIARKFQAAQNAGLYPILCVGETENERESGKTIATIRQQLAVVLEILDNLASLKQAVIAYEPVWAIGTGKVATPEQAQEVHAAIREQIKEYVYDLSQETKILYGGSVNPNNAASLFSQPDIDGGLIGGASLNASQFLEIIKQCHS